MQSTRNSILRPTSVRGVALSCKCFGIQVPDPAAKVCCDRPWPPPRGPFAMLYLSSHNVYSMTTPTTASPPPGQPPCSFMTTRHRWSALSGFSETNKSKPKQMATDAAADTLPSRSDRDGLFDKPAETSWIPNPSPSHPYDRAKAHNKRVAIMRCQIAKCAAWW